MSGGLSIFEKKIMDLGQEHIFDSSVPAEAAQVILEDIKNYGIEKFQDYISRAKTLLQDSKVGANPFEGYKVDIPTGVSVDLASSDFVDNEVIGLSKITKTAFVLVAGGLGERLGYNGIKLELPTDLATGNTHLQLYIEYLLAYSAHNSPKGSLPVEIPLVIMTSDDTHDATVALLEKNEYYGANPAQITFVKQEKVPALINNQAQVAFAYKEVNGEKVITGIETKPHGHGDVHSLILNKEGLLDDWAERGIEYVVFFQDTNSLIFNGFPAALGVSVSKNLVMNTLTVPRFPNEPVGGIAKLTKEDGSSLTINVEYNQLAPLLKASGLEDTLTDSGVSAFPGNTNSFIVRLDRYAQVLKATKGILGEFVNPKYADSERDTFKSSARLECLMQDLPKGFTGKDDIVGFTQFPRWLIFSAVKNSLADAAAKTKAGLHPECALSAEADRYACFVKLLGMAVEHSNGVFDVEEPEEKTYLGVTCKIGPKVIIHPSFAHSYKQILERVAGSTIVLHSSEPKGNSALVLKGNCQIQKIEVLGGAFICDGGMTRLEKDWALFVNVEGVENRGWFFESTIGSEKHLGLLPAPLRVRGYTLHKAESKLVHCKYVDSEEENRKRNQKGCWC